MTLFFAARRKHRSFLAELDSVDDEAEDDLRLPLVKVGDAGAANKRYGLYSLPAVVHFELGRPNVYDGEMSGKALLNWFQEQKAGSYIERVTPELLQAQLAKEEYVLALILTNCDRNAEECERILGRLEV